MSNKTNYSLAYVCTRGYHIGLLKSGDPLENMEVIRDDNTDLQECIVTLGNRINDLLGDTPENIKLFGPICEMAKLTHVEFAKVVEGVTAADVDTYGIIFGMLGCELKIYKL